MSATTFYLLFGLCSLLILLISYNLLHNRLPHITRNQRAWLLVIGTVLLIPTGVRFLVLGGEKITQGVRTWIEPVTSVSAKEVFKGVPQLTWPMANNHRGTVTLVRKGAYRVIFDAAHPLWMPTGIHIQQGDGVSFGAAGRVIWDASLPEVGPAGAAYAPRSLRYFPSQFPLLNAPCASLIGCIAGGVFPIGERRHIRARARGELYLGLNERWYTSAFADNRGSFTVQILVQR